MEVGNRVCLKMVVSPLQHPGPHPETWCLRSHLTRWCPNLCFSQVMGAPANQLLNWLLQLASWMGHPRQHRRRQHPYSVFLSTVSPPADPSLIFMIQLCWIIAVRLQDNGWSQVGRMRKEKVLDFYIPHCCSSESSFLKCHSPSLPPEGQIGNLMNSFQVGSLPRIYPVNKPLGSIPAEAPTFIKPAHSVWNFIVFWVGSVNRLYLFGLNLFWNASFLVIWPFS